MDNIELSKEESLLASRHLAEIRSYRFVMERLQADKLMAESELSYGKTRMEFIETVLADAINSLNTVDGMAHKAQDKLDEVIQGVFSRLDKPESQLGDYRLETDENGDITSLVKDNKE